MFYSFLLSSNCRSQTIIWEEHFNYPDGTKQGENNNSLNPAIDWISGTCQACIDTADWWEVRSGMMEARDVNQVVSLQTEVINISGYTNVQFSLDISELGDHEGHYFGLDACTDQDKEDFVNVLYRLDSGPWELIANYLDWCGLYQSCNTHTLYGDDGINSGDCRDHDDDWGSVTIYQASLNGNNLQIRIEVINSSTNEFIRIDNIEVKGELLLPVDFRSLNASLQGNTVILQWETHSEKNNDYFQVQRSSESLSKWESIGIKPGVGQSDVPVHYSFEDLTPVAGRLYYRLKQIDYDGTSSYSEIEQVIVPHPSSPYPNPAGDFIWVPLATSIEPVTEVQLFDIASRKISVPQSRKESFIKMDLRSLLPGHYILMYGRIHHPIIYRIIKMQ